MREIPSTGLHVSVVGVGTNNFGARIDEQATRAVIDAAIDAGVTLFDTAESYGGGASEELLGKFLDGRREQVVIATKFGWWNDPKEGAGRGSRSAVRAAIEGSLRRLRTDHVDLYQYHRPDGVTPIEETLGAMDELVREGKVRAIGSSNMDAAQVAQADGVARQRGAARFVTAQNQYSWLVRDVEAELIPACRELGIGLIPFFPLASGLLTGKYQRGRDAPPGTRLALQGGVRLPGTSAMPDAAWGRLEALEAFAARHDVSLLDVAIGGLAAVSPVVSVIAGATGPEQVRANVAAGEWQPSAAATAELQSL